MDACIPSYRVDIPVLQRIASCPWDRAVADVRFVVQIDNPKHSQQTLQQLATLRMDMGQRYGHGCVYMMGVFPCLQVPLTWAPLSTPLYTTLHHAFDHRMGLG